MSVDLRKCKPGDKLLTRNGDAVEYFGKNCFPSDGYPHLVKHQDGSVVSLSDGGIEFLFLRECSDGDIVEILK